MALLARAIEFPAADALPTYEPETSTLVITTPDDYTATAERLKTITTFRRRVVDFFKPLKDKAHAAHRSLCDAEKQALAPAEADEARIKRALVAYSDEQERKRRVEAARLEAEQYAADEARRLEEAAAMELEAAATGDVALRAQAEDVLNMPAILAPVVPTTPAAPKVTGVSFRETYRAEVVDLLSLVKAVAAGHQPVALLLPNQTALDAMARGLKGALAVSGVRVVVDKTTVTRGR